MIAMNQLQPEREKMIVYPVRMTKEQYEKCALVGRMLGVDRAKALRAMIDAVTVDGAPAADYAASYDDVLQESE
jgi:hypothetical protein